MEAMAHGNRWFSQLENSIDKGFSIAMLNNQMVPFKYSYSVCCWYNRFVIPPNTTVDGRNIQTFAIQHNPLPPKFNVNVAWGAWAPVDERNQTPNITLANTRPETLKRGVWGFNILWFPRVWIFCPSTVVFSIRGENPQMVGWFLDCPSF